MTELIVFKMYELDVTEKLIKINNGGLYSQETFNALRDSILTSVTTACTKEQSTFHYCLLEIS
jgi:hypothetical protein